MIKRFGAILLTLLYTVTVFGFALNLHYCGTLLESVKFNAPSKSCATLAEGRMMKCCKDKKIEVKVKDAHQSVSTSFTSKLFIANVPKNIFGNFITARQASVAAFCYNRPPPAPPDKVAGFVKNCTFRI